MFLFLGERQSWGSWFISTFLMYIIKFVIVVGCLIKMLVYGDSVPKPQSKEAGLFYKHKRQAENHLKKVCIYVTYIFNT